MKFHVRFTEVHEVTVEVEAASKEEAIEIVAEGEGTLLVSEAIDNQDWDTNNWEVKQVEEKGESK
jgi:hypothetical protein